MRLLTKQDADLLHAVHFINKFPKREVAFFQTLQAEYKTDPQNKETAFAYGYYQYYNHYLRGSITQLEVNLAEIVEAFDQAIAVDPDYWLAKVCKLLCLLRYPFEKKVEVQMKDLVAGMLEQQSGSGVKEGYFIIPYLIYSDFLFTLERFDEAKQVLVDGKKNVVLEPIKSQFFADFFGVIFQEYYNRIAFSKEEEILAILGEIGQRIFPQYLKRLKVVI